MQTRNQNQADIILYISSFTEIFPTNLPRYNKYLQQYKNICIHLNNSGNVGRPYKKFPRRCSVPIPLTFTKEYAEHNTYVHFPVPKAVDFQKRTERQVNFPLMFSDIKQY
jgi:hypothetical protein